MPQHEEVRDFISSEIQNYYLQYIAEYTIYLKWALFK